MASLRKLFWGLLFIVIAPVVRGQHQDINEKPEIYKGVTDTAVATGSLLEAFRKGTVNGHFRYFFMATDNQRGLTDYYANAAGGGLRYETGRFYGFQVAVSGFYTFNLGSSDFTVPDSATGQYNRYEVALFDIENPGQKSELSRLEEFYLRYNFGRGKLVFGRQFINTPFINLQDGRMRPTSVNGFWADLRMSSKWRIQGGWLFAISPRGTMKWFNAGSSIGVYPGGVNTDGSPSGYKNRVSSEGVALFGISGSLKNNIKIQLWNVFSENIFNTSFFQADIGRDRSGIPGFYGGLQAIYQTSLHDGGNPDPEKTYFQKGESSIVLGWKAGWKNRKWDANLNFTRITSHGRYLMPREWGRDPFFTFMPRERNEGYGNVIACVARINYSKPGSPFKSGISAGYFRLPAVTDFRLNKYGMPSYAQFNLDLRYRFKGILNGLEGQLLVAAKTKEGQTNGNRKYVFNKVNLLNYNLVFNFYF